MIRFFSTLRQRLLAENRLSKYLLYAIGEVFLVVIGILLALQVNEWRDRRVQDKKEQQALELLIRDLKDDYKNLQVLDHYLDKQEKGMIRLLEFIEEASDSDSIVYYAREAIGIWNYRPTYPTYEGLRQSGSLDLIRDPDIRNHIIWYHDEIIPYLDDLRAFYKEDDAKAEEAFEPYVGFRHTGDRWEAFGTLNLDALKADTRTKNILSRAGRRRGWFRMRIRNIFNPQIDSLDTALAGYLEQQK